MLKLKYFKLKKYLIKINNNGDVHNIIFIRWGALASVVIDKTLKIATKN